MIFPALRRVLVNHCGYFKSCLDRCPYPVRRNASSSNMPFSSNISEISSSFNRTLVQGKHAASVKSLLRDYGFNDAHISEVAKRGWPIFKLNAKNNLLPKLKFLSSIGLSKTDLPKLVLRIPYVLTSSLHNQLIPCCDYLTNGVPLDKGQLLKILNVYPGILLSKVETVLAPNVEFLRGSGVTPFSIKSLVLLYTPTICRNHETLKSAFNETVEMGLHPSTKRFVIALHVVCCFSKEKRARKVRLYRSFGLSDDEIHSAFQKQPTIMGISEENITKRLEFLVNELNWAPTAFVNCPVLLLLSLQKRLIPRCLVMESLVKRGLPPKVSIGTFLKLSEENFLNRFIHGYKDEFPELVEIYRRSMCSQSKTDV